MGQYAPAAVFTERIARFSEHGPGLTGESSAKPLITPALQLAVFRTERTMGE